MKRACAMRTGGSVTAFALVAASVALGVAMGIAGCGAAQKAAKQDPMSCERDPKCDKKRSGAVDCSRQCVDDPACMERCEQVQQPTGGLGH